MTEIVYLTKKGYENLKEELNNLVNFKRKEVAQALRDAREMGDISENAAYSAAKEEQTFVEGRIEELEEVLKNAQVVEENTSGAGVVGIGSKVHVHMDGQSQELHIVGAHEADPMNGRISHESPLGQALLGKGVGEKVEVEAPAGKLTYHIVKVR